MKNSGHAERLIKGRRLEWDLNDNAYIGNTSTIKNKEIKSIQEINKTKLMEPTDTITDWDNQAITNESHDNLIFLSTNQ